MMAVIKHILLSAVIFCLYSVCSGQEFESTTPEVYHIHQKSIIKSNEAQELTTPNHDSVLQNENVDDIILELSGDIPEEDEDTTVASDTVDDVELVPVAEDEIKSDSLNINSTTHLKIKESLIIEELVAKGEEETVNMDTIIASDAVDDVESVPVVDREIKSDSLNINNTKNLELKENLIAELVAKGEEETVNMDTIISSDAIDDVELVPIAQDEIKSDSSNINSTTHLELNENITEELVDVGEEETVNMDTIPKEEVLIKDESMQETDDHVFDEAEYTLTTFPSLIEYNNEESVNLLPDLIVSSHLEEKESIVEHEKAVVETAIQIETAEILEGVASEDILLEQDNEIIETFTEDPGREIIIGRDMESDQEEIVFMPELTDNLETEHPHMDINSVLMQKIIQASLSDEVDHEEEEVEEKNEIGYNFATDDWMAIPDYSLKYDRSFTIGGNLLNAHSSFHGTENKKFVMSVSLLDTSSSISSCMVIGIKASSILDVELCSQDGRRWKLEAPIVEDDISVHSFSFNHNGNTLTAKVDDKDYRSGGSSSNSSCGLDVCGGLFIGGTEDNMYDNFFGCISSLSLEGENHFLPLKEYSDGSAQFIFGGLPRQGGCAVSPVPLIPPSLYHDEEVLETHDEALLPKYETVISNTTEISDGWTTDTSTKAIVVHSVRIWPLALLASFVALILMIILVCCLRKFAKVRSKRSRTDLEMQGRDDTDAPPPPPYSLEPKNSEKENLLGKDKYSPKIVESGDLQQANNVQRNSVPLLQISSPSSIEEAVNRSSEKIPYIDDFSSDEEEIDKNGESEDLRVNSSPMNEDIEETKVRNGTPKADIVHMNGNSREIDMQAYYLRKKASVPPGLPPKTK